MKSQLASSKGELAGIFESVLILENDVQYLETKLNASNHEKAEVVDSKKRVAINMKETNMRLKMVMEQFEVIEEKLANFYKQRGTGRIFRNSNFSLNAADQGAGASLQSKEKG